MNDFFKSRTTGLFEFDASAHSNGAATGGTDVDERFHYDPYGTKSEFGSVGADSAESAGWEYIFQSGRLDQMAVDARPRDFIPAVGRWIDQEPLARVDGATLFETE
jgi:hypothetical protein